MLYFWVCDHTLSQKETKEEERGNNFGGIWTKLKKKLEKQGKRRATGKVDKEVFQTALH